jgi:hypothetical protein
MSSDAMFHISTLTETQVSAIAGGISLILAVALVVYYQRAKQLLDEMWAVDTYSASELRRMCSGGFDAVVEVQGQVSCDRPVTATYSQFPCVWCHTRVEREMTRVAASRSGVRTTHVWETGYDQVLTAIFKVSDETGYTLVDPTRADIDTEDPYVLITDRREPWFESVGRSDTGRYRITEEIFVPTGYAYILGEASSCQEGVQSDVLMHYPSEGYTDPGKRFFIISRKSEKEITGAKEFSLRICFWAGILGFLFAAYCALHALGMAL